MGGGHSEANKSQRKEGDVDGGLVGSEGKLNL